ncbi:MAG: DNA-3-methyladenine glycosylase I [Bacteroidetes bacterium]|nr:DNA-3-methyladenine glycosylase I [Bacteroidota bacterium]MDA0937796.1 DNA-3-methyladenine glycosylase I [Bacteroidota bacterium]MDA1344174.1 DNA-3-methyladenine glycosylase I [Bacteroidota bacterium]
MQNKHRCVWCLGDPLYEAYHDHEWGVPVIDDQTLFEFLTLETFQAGLSWITVLRKRAHFRTAFDAFDYQKIARYSVDKIESLLENPEIIRNRLKILATISNANAFIKLQKEYGSFGRYIWSFVDFETIQNRFSSYDQIPAFSPLAQTFSKALKKEGFKFIGPTVVYAHMQATGMVNDHEVQCFRHQEVAALKTRPLALKG